MSKFIKGFFALDLWIALSLITTMLANMLFSYDQILMITLSIVFALVNAIFCVIIMKSVNFYKTKSIKRIN